MSINLSISAISDIRKVAGELGFDRVSVGTVQLPERYVEAYRRWCADGAASGMDYMTREQEKRCEVTRVFPDVRSVITLAISYYRGEFPAKPGPAFGRIARYAWGEDYHLIIRGRLEQFQEKLQTILGSSVESYVATDTKPVLERAFAETSGLGFIGKNTVLIAARGGDSGGVFHVGSWVFLAEIFLTAAISGEEPIDPIEGCGSCRRCLDACPTAAFDAAYRLNADRCLAYLTIENKGWIPRSVRPLAGDWIFGCDVCQEVCPFNARAFESRWPEFAPTRGPGPWLSLRDVLETKSPSEFRHKWGATALSRAKLNGLKRNACVAAGNSGDESLVPFLLPLLEGSSSMVRGHALWAANRLSSPREASRLAERLLTHDSDPLVLDECRAVLNEIPQ